MKKKWFFVFLILVVVAIVLAIVFVNLFRKKDTHELAESVHSKVSDGYLNENNADFKAINEYFGTVYVVLTTSEEKSEVKNYQNSYKAYVIEGQFFDRNLIFGQYCETYKNNRKNVQNALNKAQEMAKNLADYINKNKDLTQGSAYWHANTWANCKEYAQEMFKYTVDAFNLLGEIYRDSMPSKISNNSLTQAIFKQIDSFSSEIKQKLHEDENLGTKLYNFVETYMTKDGENLILNFSYNLNAQNIIKDILEKGAESAFYSNFVAGRIEG